MEGLVINLLNFLFSKHRHLIYTAFSEDQYFAAVSKLQSGGVSYRTRVTNLDIGTYGGLGRSNQYDIYVKKDDLYRAQQAINGRC